MKVAIQRSRGKSILGRRNSQFEGLEVESSLAYPRKNKTSVTRVQGTRGQWRGGQRPRMTDHE